VLNLVYVGFGGFLGASLRYLISLVLHKSIFATLLANILGCFLIGIVLTKVENQPLKLFLATGFLGGLTTFSTFSFETFRLLENGMFFKATAYSLGSLLMGFLALFVGMSFIK